MKHVNNTIKDLNGEPDEDDPTIMRVIQGSE